MIRRVISSVLLSSMNHIQPYIFILIEIEWFLDIYLLVIFVIVFLELFLPRELFDIICLKDIALQFWVSKTTTQS